MNGEGSVPRPTLDGSYVTPKVGSDLFPRIQPLFHGSALSLDGFEEPIGFSDIGVNSVAEVSGGDNKRHWRMSYPTILTLKSEPSILNTPYLNI